MFEFMMKAAAEGVTVEIVPIKPVGSFRLIFKKGLSTGVYTDKRVFDETGARETAYPLMDGFLNEWLEAFINNCSAIESDE